MPSGIVQPNQQSSSFDKQPERLVTGSKSPNGPANSEAVVFLNNAHMTYHPARSILHSIAL